MIYRSAPFHNALSLYPNSDHSLFFFLWMTSRKLMLSRARTWFILFPYLAVDNIMSLLGTQACMSTVSSDRGLFVDPSTLGTPRF